MLRLAAAHSPRRETLATDGVDEVCAMLRRHDRIVWFLRLWSRNLLRHAEDLPAFSASQRRRLRRLERALGRPRFADHWSERQDFLRRWWGLAVTAEKVPFLRRKLAGLKLNSFRSFGQANEWLGRLEQEVERMQDHQQAVDVVWIFPNGWRWVRCAYDASVVEGRLMGHCGNRANTDPDCELLSLREPVRVDGVLFWRPHLTFTFSHGYLGEMKGRNNAKPGRELHPYILRLLLNPMVKGFSASLGALPDRDFEFSDFDPASRMRVYFRVPGFSWEARERAMAKWRARYRPEPAKRPLPATAATVPAALRREPGAWSLVAGWLGIALVTGPGWVPFAYALWIACTR
jgi:hypothetical protein